MDAGGPGLLILDVLLVGHGVELFIGQLAIGVEEGHQTDAQVVVYLGGEVQGRYGDVHQEVAVVHLAGGADGVVRLGIDLLHDVDKAVGLVVVDVVDLEGGHNGLGLKGHVLLVIGEAVLLGAVYQLQIVLVADALIQQVHVPLDQDGGGGFPQLGLHLFPQPAAGRQRQQGTQGQHCGGDALDMLHGVAPFLSLDSSFIS